MKSLLKSIRRSNYGDTPFKNVGFVDQAGRKPVDGVLAKICNEGQAQSEITQSMKGFQRGKGDLIDEWEWGGWLYLWAAFEGEGSLGTPSIRGVSETLNWRNRTEESPGRHWIIIYIYNIWIWMWIYELWIVNRDMNVT